MNRYRSELKNYLFYRIRNFIGFILITGLCVYFIVIILYHVFNILMQDAFQQSLNKINNLNSLFLAFLTLVLVLVTTFYAWVTFKMFRVQSEQRKLELRPNLIVSVNDPEFTNEKHKIRITSFPFHISNYGRGPAINTVLEFSIPYSRDPNTNEFQHMSSSYRINPFLQSNETHSGTKDMYPDLYELDEINKEFLIVSVIYEDIQRNLYSLKQFYDLRKIIITGSFEKSYLFFKGELSFFIPQRKRIKQGFNDRSFDYEHAKLLWKTYNFN